MKKQLYILLTLGALACGKSEPQETETARDSNTRSVRLTQPQFTSTNGEIVASGILTNKSELKLAFKTGGMINKMYVSEGQYVKKGQLLATLDMSEINAGVQQANLGLQKAARDLEKVKNLYADEVATKTMVDDATTAYNVAKESVQAASFNQQLSKIVAPQSGIILKKISEQGELITPFMPALILGTGGHAFDITVGLSDRDIVRVRKGNTATVKLDAYPDETFTATIHQLAQTVNPATGTYDVEMSLNAPNKNLISGFVATVHIKPPAEKQTLTIPVEALLEADGNTAFVFVANGNMVTKKKIEIGSLSGQRVTVKNGLTPADYIVSEGAAFLSDGDQIDGKK